MSRIPNQEEAFEALSESILFAPELQHNINNEIQNFVKKGMLPVIAAGVLVSEFAHVCTCLVVQKADLEGRAPTENDLRELFKIFIDKILDECGEQVRRVDAEYQEAKSKQKAA